MLARRVGIIAYAMLGLILNEATAFGQDSGAFTVSAVIGTVSPSFTINSFNPAAPPGAVLERTQVANLYSGMNFVRNSNYRLTFNFSSPVVSVNTVEGPKVGVALEHDGIAGAVLMYLAFRRTSNALVSFTEPQGCSLTGANNSLITFNQIGEHSCQVSLSGLQAVSAVDDWMNTSMGEGDFQIAVDNTASGAYSSTINFTLDSLPS